MDPLKIALVQFVVLESCMII